MPPVTIRDYEPADEEAWLRCRVLAFLHTAYYDDARGIMLASGSQAMHVLMLQPQMIEALGLPKPTDPKYPYK